MREALEASTYLNKQQPPQCRAALAHEDEEHDTKAAEVERRDEVNVESRDNGVADGTCIRLLNEVTLDLRKSCVRR